MKILKLVIDGFGKFRDYEIDFDSGMTVIIGLNEAGKSTLHECIRSLLFGMKRAKGAASYTDRWSDLKPWDNGPFAAAMILEHEGKRYRLTRDFDKDPEGYKITLEDGTPIPDPEEFYRNILHGMTEVFYDNTISVGQLKSASDDKVASELHEYILNMNTTGNRALSTERAVEYLEKQKRQIMAAVDEDCIRKYTANLAEIRSLEQEAEKPEYENHLKESRTLLKELEGDTWKNSYKQELLAAEVSENRKIREKISGIARISHIFAVLAILGLIPAVLASTGGRDNVISSLTGIGWTTVLAIGGGAFILFLLVYIILRVRILGMLETIKEREEEELERLKTEGEELGERTRNLNESIRMQNVNQSELVKKLIRINALKEENDSFRRQMENNDRIRENVEAIDYAIETMGELAEHHKNSFGRYLNKTASENIRRITGGIYDSISIDEELGVCINTAGGMVPLRQVSSGTRDQIYLAVRLAAAELIGGSSLPLILDDSFVNYDQVRMKEAINWIAETYEGQTLIFTCHERVDEVDVPHKTIRI